MTGAGIFFELLGSGRSRTCHIKLNAIPYLEFYQPITDGGSVISNINMTKSTNEDRICATMIKELNETKGDVNAWAKILLSYYKTALSRKLSDVKVMKEQSIIEDHGHLKQLIGQEVSDGTISAFAAAVDATYKCRLDVMIGYNHVRNYLMPEEDLATLYHQFREQFPLLHHTFHSMISSKYLRDKMVDNNAATLHQKQRLILFLALSSIQAKSSHKLQIFAIIKQLALFYIKAFNNLHHGLSLVLSLRLLTPP